MYDLLFFRKSGFGIDKYRDEFYTMHYILYIT